MERMSRNGRPRLFKEQDVVERAKDVFWEHGYAATSLRDLREQLRVLPGSIYGAFGDKHALFLRALEQFAADTRNAAERLGAASPALPAIQAMLEGVLGAACSSPGRGCMLGNTALELLPGDAGAGKLVREAFAALEQGLEIALARGQASGEVRRDIDCRAQARMLLALVQGLHVVARAEADPHRLDDAIAATIAALAAPSATQSQRKRPVLGG